MSKHVVTSSRLMSTLGAALVIFLGAAASTGSWVLHRAEAQAQVPLQQVTELKEDLERRDAGLTEALKAMERRTEARQVKVEEKLDRLINHLVEHGTQPARGRGR